MASIRHEFAERPGLERAAAGAMRRVAIHHFADMAQAGFIQMRVQRRQEAGPCRLPRLRRVAAHPQPGLDERAQQPGPGGALVIGAVALARAAREARPVVGVGRVQRAQAERGEQPRLHQVDDAARERRRRHRRCGRPPTARIWFGRTRRCSAPSPSTRSNRPPLAGSGKRSAKAAARVVGQRAPDRAAGPGGGLAQRVDPQRLHLHRLAAPRRHHPVADLGVHPGELLPRRPGPDQAVRVHADAEPGASAGALEDRQAGRAQPGRHVRRDARPPAGRARR